VVEFHLGLISDKTIEASVSIGRWSKNVRSPGLAFAVILITNALLVLASFRVRRSAPATAGATEVSVEVPSLSVPPAHPRRRWVLNAVMLLLLAVGGVGAVVWESS
jgi:hypothetical protein